MSLLLSNIVIFSSLSKSLDKSFGNTGGSPVAFSIASPNFAG